MGKNIPSCTVPCTLQISLNIAHHASNTENNDDYQDNSHGLLPFISILIARGTYGVLFELSVGNLSAALGACGLEGLAKILRRGEINPALLDQLGARLVSESVPHHAYDLLLGKGLCRASTRRCSADLEVSMEWCHGHPARARAWPGWPWHIQMAR